MALVHGLGVAYRWCANGLRRESSMQRMLDPIRRHPVLSYVVLATGFSWAWWIPMALRGELVTRGGVVTHFPGLLGPLLAGLAVTAIVDGRVGLRAFSGRLVRWRVPRRWYL